MARIERIQLSTKKIFLGQAAASSNALDFKDFTAILAVFAPIVLYWTAVRARFEWTRKKAAKLGNLGGVFSAVITWPDRLVGVFVGAALVSTVAYFVFRVVYDTNQPTVQQGAADTWLRDVLQWNASNYFIGFIIWLVVVSLAYFNVFGRVAAKIAARVPRWRETIGWANASWYIEQGESAPSFALASAVCDSISDQLLHDAASGRTDAVAALRPAGLDDDEAANILYFGHVVEEYLSDQSPGTSVEWKKFYAAFSEVALQADRPCRASSIKQAKQPDFYRQVLKRFDAVAVRLNAAGGKALDPIPDTVPLEQSVNSAFKMLREQWGGDARDIGRIVQWHTYTTALRHIRSVLRKEEMCRQFAKLAVIWSIWPKYRRPRVFRLPFSRRIALHFMERSYLISDAGEIRADDPRLIEVVAHAEHQLLSRSRELLDATSDPALVSWRDQQNAIAAQLNVDRKWFFEYRFDLALYALSTEQAASAKDWEIRDGTTFARKKKPGG